MILKLELLIDTFDDALLALKEQSPDEQQHRS